MWHEARRREKATQKLFNDHKKRAEKRREEDRIDPNSFLQVHGLKTKLCLDPAVYKQAIKSLVAWQGDQSVTIDRFDVRATLHSIPDESETTSYGSTGDPPPSKPSRATVLDANESEPMKRLLNYERYRLLIQNDLSKVPDDLRLKLVANSDISSDAKMRKLRNNKFGTSGETSISSSSSANNHHLSSGRGMMNRSGREMLNRSSNKEQQSRKGAAIGFNYNSVPPPPSLTDGKSFESTQRTNEMNEVAAEVVEGSAALGIMDLDNIELDGISVAQFDSKRINETARKYGLSSDEFSLLAERDAPECGVGELLKELIKLNERIKNSLNSSGQDSTSRQKRQIYGPALPPELEGPSTANHRPPSRSPSASSPSSSFGSPPVRQRSPSGAEIPLRNGLQSQDRNDSTTPPNHDATKSERKSSRDERPVEKSHHQSQDVARDAPCQRSSPKPTHSRTVSKSRPEQPSSHCHKSGTKSPPLEQDDNGNPPRRCEQGTPERRKDASEVDDTRHSPPPRSQRASTPLAYRRNCRSSRSVSRERRSYNRHYDQRHSSRHRKPSSSRKNWRRSRTRSISSSSASFTSRNSRSSSNSSSRARHSKRRRRTTYRRRDRDR